MNKPIPLLWLSDAVSCTSGLGRISRDVCTRIATKMPDVFRVAALGYGGPGRRDLPFPQYHIHSIENWQVPELPMVWKDFAGDEEGILMVCWDASRVGWLTDPRQAPPHLRHWLANTKIRKFTYTPVDAAGPNERLSVKLSNTLKGFERVLNYSKWSASVTGYPDFLPHGIDDEAFKPLDKKDCRQKFIDSGFVGLKQSSFLVGIVATNQARKDFALGIQTVKELLKRGLDARVWIHTDTIERYWDLGALVVDYELQGRVVITTSNFTDEQMNSFYSACDVTLGIGKGEGFGFPIFESIASGTPCIHGDYGGAAEFLPTWMKVTPYGYFYEGPFCCKRPTFSSGKWATYAEGAAKQRVHFPDELHWSNLWPRWEKWLRAGVEKPIEKKKLERVK